MTDTNPQQSAQKSQSKSLLIQADKSKSNEQYIAEVEQYYIVPKLVRETFPDLMKLVFETESMDVDEREYWLQILPIMTEDQVKKFRDILVNEKEQLQKLDTEYQSEMSKLNQSQNQVISEEEMRRRREEIKAREEAEALEEAKKEAALLEQLKNL